MWRVRGTREVIQGQWDRKDVPKVRNTQNFPKLSRHRLQLENSVSISVAAVYRMRTWPETDKTGKRLSEGPCANLRHAGFFLKVTKEKQNFPIRKVM